MNVLAVDLTTFTAAVPAILSVVLALAALAGALGSLASATNATKTADKLDTAHEALDVVGQVGQRVAGGQSLPAAIAAVAPSDEAKDLIARFKVFAHLTALLLCFVFLAGCASPVTPAQIDHLEKALQDERKAVTVRPGFEDKVTTLRAAEDKDVAAIRSACQ